MFGYILNSKYETVGILDINTQNGLPILDDSRKQQLSKGYSTLTIDIPSNHPQSALLEIEGYIAYLDFEDGHELYRIKEINERHSSEPKKTVRCEPSATADLLSKRIRPIKYASQSLSQVMDALLSGTGWQLGETFYDDMLDVELTDYPTVLEAIHTVIEQFDAEIQFEVIFNGINIVKKVVNLYEKRGSKTNAIFEYGHNLSGVTREENTDQLITAIIAVGKEEDGKRVVISNATAALPSGFEVIGDMVADSKALDTWFDDGIHREGLYNDSNAQSPNELMQNALAELKKYNKPILTYTVDVVKLEQLTGYSHQKISIGDTILIKDWTFPDPLFLNARVLEKESSKTNIDKGTVVLGEFVQLNVKPITAIQKLQRTIGLKQDYWNSAMEEAKKAQEAVSGVSVYKVEINSTNGTVFKDGVLATSLIAKVYKGSADITDTLLPIAFTWTKTDPDGTEDIAWGNAFKGAGKSIAVSEAQDKATFTCSVDTNLTI